MIIHEYKDADGIDINQGDLLVAVQNDALDRYWQSHGSRDNHPEEFVRIIGTPIPVCVVDFDGTPLSLCVAVLNEQCKYSRTWYFNPEWCKHVWINDHDMEEIW